MLLEIARTKNSLPLPQIRPHCGIRLPPDRYCMTACNYELRSNKKVLFTIIMLKKNNVNYFYFVFNFKKSFNL